MLRALVATLVVVGFGGWAHQMGGGAPLRLIPAVVLTLLVGPVVCLCVRRRSSVPRMLVATSLGQVVTHVALTGMTPRTGGSAVRLHLHEVAAPLPLLPTEGSSALSSRACTSQSAPTSCAPWPAGWSSSRPCACRSPTASPPER